MEWSKTYENNNTEIHSWLRVNLRVWPNDGAALSTGLAERNWVWNSRPRSITAPDWKQKEHSNIGQGGLLVLWPGAKKRKTSWKSQGYSLESRNQESWIRYEQRINIMASEKVNRRLLDILYAFFDSQVEGVTKCYLYIPLLGLSPEVCVITTLCVWQEPYVKLHACMSERVWERAWVCIHMCASYSFPYRKRSCQVCSTQKLDMGEDKRVMGDITGLLRAHFITMALIVGN